MRPFTHTIPLAEARAILDGHSRRIARTETVALEQLGGRVLASDITAAADVPPFARAMMDGYAVRAADTSGATAERPRRLSLIGRVFTGEVADGTLAGGQCLEIATGAPLPRGADAVVMVEEAAPAEGGRVEVRAPAAAGQHVGRQGADITAGSVVVRDGEVLLPGRLGAVAALGLTAATVYARPRVALISTGNEVVRPGAPLGPGQIHDVNRYTLTAIVEAHGGEPHPLDVAADTLAALDAAVDRAAGSDLIVFSGGSSVGDRDLVLDVLHARGTVHFHGIQTRPGKPTAFGMLGGVPVFGLPGNPTSCLTNAYVLLVPYLRTLARLPAHAPRRITVPLARSITSSAGRTQFYSVRIVDGRAEPAFKASGDITSLAHADGYVEIPSEVGAVEAGTAVEVVYFD